MKDAPVDRLCTDPCIERKTKGLREKSEEFWGESVMTDVMKQHCSGMQEIKEWKWEWDGRGGICAAGCWTAAWAQDKGSCPNCLTSLMGDILDRTSGNSGVSVTTSSDWPVGHAIAFTRLLYWKTESTPWLPHGCKYSQVALVLQTQQIKLQGSQNIKNGSPKHIVIN